jgi:hypothetical protein
MTGRSASSSILPLDHNHHQHCVPLQSSSLGSSATSSSSLAGIAAAAAATAFS